MRPEAMARDLFEKLHGYDLGDTTPLAFAEDLVLLVNTLEAAYVAGERLGLDRAAQSVGPVIEEWVRGGVEVGLQDRLEKAIRALSPKGDH